MKIDVESYPRYDKETITRKIRVVTGKSHTYETRLTNPEFERVMELCAEEYRIRGYQTLISSRTMDRLEYLSALRADLLLSQRTIDGLVAQQDAAIDAPRQDG